MILIICFFIVLLTVGVLYLWLINDVKKEVNAAPRIPMFICPANPSHGAFPAKHTMKITVPAEGAIPLEHEMCPFCYDEKMKEAEKIFKK